MPFRSTACGRLGRIAVALGMILSAAVPASSEPTPLRIGVSYVPPPADIPAARLYTQEGFDLDLAGEIGRRLGRKVTLVGIGHEGAAEAVTSGRLDALIVRLAEDDTEFASLDVVPSGYTSSLSVSMRIDTDVSGWDKLAGRTVCVSAANQDAQLLARSLGAKLAVQPAPALSLMRVRTGECDAALHDEETLRSLLGDPEWKKFSATLPAQAPTRLAVVLPKAGGPQIDAIRSAIPNGSDRRFWNERLAQWAKDVALEVYLDQDAPDCH